MIWLMYRNVKGYIRVGIFAKRNIAIGEEITMDYKVRRKMTLFLIL